MKRTRWIAAVGLVVLADSGTPARAVPLVATISKGDATKFGEDLPERAENGNSKVSITGTCNGEIPEDLDLETCDLVLDGLLFRTDPDARCTGELVFDAAGRPVPARGTLVDGCACTAGDTTCTSLCDPADPSCYQTCPGGKASEVTFRSDQRARPTLKLRLKRREVDHRPRLEFAMTVDRAVTAPSSTCPGGWDPDSGTAFPPVGHACIETSFHLWCGRTIAERRPYSCSTGVDWRPTSSGKPAAFTNLRTRGEACVPPPCATDADCLDHQYCHRVEGACWALGECTHRPDVCIQSWDPVCGCDGRTHSNAACAAVDGTSIASRGPCP